MARPVGGRAAQHAPDAVAQLAVVQAGESIRVEVDVDRRLVQAEIFAADAHAGGAVGERIGHGHAIAAAKHEFPARNKFLTVRDRVDTVDLVPLYENHGSSIEAGRSGIDGNNDVLPGYVGGGDGTRIRGRINVDGPMFLRQRQIFVLN